MIMGSRRDVTSNLFLIKKKAPQQEHDIERNKFCFLRSSNRKKFTKKIILNSKFYVKKCLNVNVDAVWVLV